MKKNLWNFFHMFRNLKVWKNELEFSLKFWVLKSIFIFMFFFFLINLILFYFKIFILLIPSSKRRSFKRHFYLFWCQVKSTVKIFKLTKTGQYSRICMCSVYSGKDWFTEKVIFGVPKDKEKKYFVWAFLKNEKYNRWCGKKRRIIIINVHDMR